MEILKNQPYIKDLIAVIKNSMMQTPRKIFVNGRLNDAFVYILSGACTYIFENGSQYVAQSGDVLYLANHAVYEMKLQTEKYEFIYVNFLFDGEQFFESKVYSCEENYNFLPIFKKMYQEYRSMSAHSRITCMRQLYDIYSLLCEMNERTYVPDSLREKMEASKEYMQLHYAEINLSIATLAERAEMSEVYYRKMFQATYKVSPKKYLTLIRIKKSCQLLEYSFLSLEEVAVLCGFSSWQYFSRVFKNKTGESPASYRKKKIKGI